MKQFWVWLVLLGLVCLLACFNICGYLLALFPSAADNFIQNSSSFFHEPVNLLLESTL